MTSFYVVGHYTDSPVMNSIITEYTTKYRNVEIYISLFHPCFKNHDFPSNWNIKGIKILDKPLSNDEISLQGKTIQNILYNHCYNQCVDMDQNKNNVIVFVYSIIPTQTLNFNNNFILYPNVFDLQDKNSKSYSCVSIRHRIKTSSFYTQHLTKNVSFSYKDIEINETSPVIVIPSVINITKHDSIITSENRFQQTLLQCKRLKELYPHTKIILCETSFIFIEELLLLSQYTDFIWLCHQDNYCMQLAHNDKNKNKTEIYLMKTILLHLKNNEYMTHICKFGGRYWFNKQIDNLFLNDKCVMKTFYAECYNQTVVEPVFYSVCKRYFDKYLSALNNIERTLQTTFTDVERLLWDHFAKDVEIYKPPYLHIMGYMAGTELFRYF